MKFNDLTQQQKDIILKYFFFSTSPPYLDDFSDFLDVIADIFGRLSKEEIDSIMVHGPGPIREVVRNSMSLPSTQRIVRYYYDSSFQLDFDSVYEWFCEDLDVVVCMIREIEI